MDTIDDFVQQLKRVRPVMRHLIESILLDVWPNHTAIVDFGIDSQEHYEALYYPVREHEIMPEILDRAFGNGQMLTAMVRYAPAIRIRTSALRKSWDLLRLSDRSLNREEPEIER